MLSPWGELVAFPPLPPPPVDDADIPRYIAAVEQHALYQAVLAAEANAGADTAVQFKPGGRWDPARIAIHTGIVQLLVSPAQRPIHEPPLGVLLLGLPGAGKTTKLKPIVQQQNFPGRTWTVVDPDDIKARLPGYQGIIASRYHEESSEVCSSRLVPTTLGLRHDILFDQVGGNLTSLAARIDMLDAAQYEVHAVIAKVPIHFSVQSVVERFAANGRWVPPRLVADMASALDRSIEYIKDSEIVETYQIWDTSGPIEKAPVLLESRP